MDKHCGTCKHWAPPEIKEAGSLKLRSVDPKCLLFNERREADQKPKSWCWAPKDQ